MRFDGQIFVYFHHVSDVLAVAYSFGVGVAPKFIFTGALYIYV